MNTVLVRNHRVNISTLVSVCYLFNPLLFIPACLVDKLNALNCYSCDTNVNGQSDCGDPFSAGGKYGLKCPVETQSYCVVNVFLINDLSN